jgi:two-component system sensor histidine kinase PrrB
LSRLSQSALVHELQANAAPGIDGDRTIRVIDVASGEARLSIGQSLDGPAALFPTGLSTQRISGARYRVDAVDVVPGLALRPDLPGQSSIRVQVQVIAPTASIRAAGRSIRRRVLLVGAGALVLIVLLTLLITGRELRPLRRLADVAGRIGDDEDLAVRAPTDGPPEIRTVSQAFNAMLGRIQVSATGRQQALDTARSFAADAAHELRTPLTSMAANLELLAGAGPVDPAVVKALQVDHARLAGTLESLHALTVGDLTSSGSEPVDLADLVELVGRESNRHPGLQISVQTPSEPVVVRGDREALRLVIDNLLTNAERHARPSGETAVRVTLAPDGPWCLLSVEDDGRGFPDAGAEQLLDRFARGDTAAPGSGLGLAIVTQQVRRHGGEIALGRSELGGARVQLRLPTTTP